MLSRHIRKTSLVDWSTNSFFTFFSSPFPQITKPWGKVVLQLSTSPLSRPLGASGHWLEPEYSKSFLKQPFCNVNATCITEGVSFLFYLYFLLFYIVISIVSFFFHHRYPSTPKKATDREATGGDLSQWKRELRVFGMYQPLYCNSFVIHFHRFHNLSFKTLLSRCSCQVCEITWIPRDFTWISCVFTWFQPSRCYWCRCAIILPCAEFVWEYITAEVRLAGPLHQESLSFT